jgi:hypothetical protein
MTSNQKFSALVCGLCTAVLACDGPALEPVAPSTAETSVLLRAGWKASGHALVHGTPVQNVLEQRYSFTAVSTDASSTATGQLDVHYVRFTGEVQTVHAEVTCMSIVGNQAWIGTVITRLTVNGTVIPDRVGVPMIFRVVDGGEGENAGDLASLVFQPGAGGDIAHCTTRPDFPILRESTGTIQVKPE